MSFKTITVITAILMFVLGIGYLFAGEIVIGRWQIEPTDGVLLFGRRLAAFYLGLSVTFFLARSTPISVARRALCAGTAVACSLLALLGVYEFSVGHAARSILASVVVEALLALGYIWTLLIDRRGAVGG